MKLCIGITTYNRLDILKRMSASLLSTRDLTNCNIRIYDDCSTEFGLDEIRKVFPSASEIIIRKENLGADSNMRQMFIDFLKTSDNYLLIADADLIFDPEWYEFFLKNSALDVLSLYNSASHLKGKTVETSYQDSLLKKIHIGAAGTIFKREIIDLIIQNVPPSRSYDWDWSKFLVNNGYFLNVSNRSYVQHIGIHGTNNDGASIVDFGLNFFPGNSLNEHYLIDFFQNALISKDDFIKNSYSPKILLRKGRSLFKIIRWKLKTFRS